jgi:parallel beta-helix repeat protein
MQLFIATSCLDIKYLMDNHMKKIFIFIILFITITTLHGQRTLTINETWTSTHIESTDVIVPSGIVLTIDPGAIVKFGSGKSLKITGTGSLLAGSLTGSSVTFTANNGISWGHVYCENTTTSYLRNCIIEKGNAVGLNVAYGPNYGGGVYANTSILTIENCTIKNNNAVYGGGLFIGSSKSPAIKNSIIHTNTATEAGGGLYIWQSSNSVITNCIIYNNSCTGATFGGGGIFLGYSTGNVRIINCVITNNTASNQGRGIYFYSSGFSKIINSIIWGGSGNPLYFNSTSTSVMEYSAVQGGSYTTCINLDASNTASNGPNFVNPGISDWSIEFISPCRDAGTITTPAVPTDFDGSSRIGPYDIGAYEVKFNRWKTTASSSDWVTASNWDQGVPTSNQNIAIPSGATYYPTGSPNQDYTIGSGHGMVVDIGARVTLNALTNNGTVALYSTSAGIASLILTSYTDNGAEEIQLYLSGGGTVNLDNFKWHYISSPVSSLPVSTFAPGTTLDVAHFVESRPTFSLLEGWVAYDGYVYSTGLTNGPTFSNLTPGLGYNYWDNANNTFTFSGSLNTSNAAMSLGYSGTPSLHGFNLLGNPFSSGLDWDQIIDDSYFTYPSETSKSLYFTRDNVQSTYAAGVGVPSDVSGIIPPMQGFFVKTYATGKTITLPAAARTHNSIHARYKGSAIIPLIRLELKRDSVTPDEAVVRFDELAKAGYDYDFDAVKMFISATKTQIWSSLSGTDYAINGQPFPETLMEIPIVINLTKDTIHTISATQLQGLDNYTVTLTDNLTGFTANLKTTPAVTFTASAGTISDRFILTFNSLTTATEDPYAASKTVFNIYNTYGLINIQTMADEWDGLSGSVRILDLAGRIVTDQQNREFSKNSVVQVQGPGAKGLYIVEIRSDMKSFVGKVVMK